MPARIARASQNDFEAEHRARNAFDRAVILLDNVVEVFYLRNLYRYFAVLDQLLQCGLVFAALLRRNLVGHSVVLVAFSRKRLAAAASPLAANRKLTLWPRWSTALYRYFQAPLILMYVSSILQLGPTARLCLRKALSSNGETGSPSG
jgi:hypothetical protein